MLGAKSKADAGVFTAMKEAPVCHNVGTPGSSHTRSHGISGRSLFPLHSGCCSALMPRSNGRRRIVSSADLPIAGESTHHIIISEKGLPDGGYSAALNRKRDFVTALRGCGVGWPQAVKRMQLMAPARPGSACRSAARFARQRWASPGWKGRQTVKFKARSGRPTRQQQYAYVPADYRQDMVLSSSVSALIAGVQFWEETRMTITDGWDGKEGDLPMKRAGRFYEISPCKAITYVNAAGENDELYSSMFNDDVCGVGRVRSRYCSAFICLKAM